MPNPKHSVLQSTYDEVEKCSIVETSQSLMLSTWSSQYAIGPSAMELHMTFSPSWRSDIMTSTDGAYGCREGNGGVVSGLLPAAAQRKAGQIYVDIDAIEFHAQFVRPVSPYTPPSLGPGDSRTGCTRRRRPQYPVRWRCAVAQTPREELSMPNDGVYSVAMQMTCCEISQPNTSTTQRCVCVTFLIHISNEVYIVNGIGVGQCVPAIELAGGDGSAHLSEASGATAWNADCVQLRRRAAWKQFDIGIDVAMWAICTGVLSKHCAAFSSVVMAIVPEDTSWRSWEPQESTLGQVHQRS
eukprot:COSAG02_NODE_825_length_16730_cov_58.738260_18_plen_298_part_00